MEKLKQLLLGGSFLTYLSVNSLINGLYDSWVITIIGQYLLLAMGIGMLLFGFAVVFSIKEVSVLKKLAVAAAYPMIAAGGAMLLISWFGAAMRAGDGGLLISGWMILAAGIVLILAGAALSRTVK